MSSFSHRLHGASCLAGFAAQLARAVAVPADRPTDRPACRLAWRDGVCLGTGAACAGHHHDDHGSNVPTSRPPPSSRAGRIGSRATPSNEHFSVKRIRFNVTKCVPSKKRDGFHVSVPARGIVALGLIGSAITFNTLSLLMMLVPRAPHRNRERRCRPFRLCIGSLPFRTSPCLHRALSTCRRVDKAVAGAATMPLHISLRALLWRRAT